MKKSQNNVYKVLVRAHRGEIKEGSTKFKVMSKGEECRYTTFKDAETEAVYTGWVEIEATNANGLSLTKQEQMQLQNAVTGYFVIYGEDCLDKNMLLDSLTEFLPELKIVDILDSEISRFYKFDTMGLRGTINVYQSDMETLTIREDVHTV